jgi:thioredoxin 1
MKRLLFVLVMGILLVGCKKEAHTPNFSLNQTQMINPVARVVVYDFWAPWCPPCRAFSPVFEGWKLKYGNRNIEFKKVNIDEDQSTAAKFNIGSIPTVIVTVNGEEAKRWVGAPRESDIQEFLK